MRVTRPERWLAGVDGCAGGWIVAFVRPEGGEARAADRAALCRRAVRAGAARRSWPSTCRSACRSGSASAAAPPRTASVRCSAPGSRRCSRCRRAQRSMPPTIARPAGSRSDVGPAAQGVEAALQHRAENPRGGRGLRANSDAAARVFEVHPELAFWRLNGDRALTEPKKVKSRPYEPGLALRRRLLIAAGLPDDAVNALAAQGRGGRRSARRAGLRRHRAAHSCRARRAVPEPAAA